MVPKVLAILVLVMILIFASFSVVTKVIGNQGDSLLDQGKNINKGLDCVFNNKDSANDKCIEESSGSDSGDDG